MHRQILIPALFIAFMTSACSSGMAQVMGMTIGTVAGAQVTGKVVDRVFDGAWPMRAEEDRRELTTEYAERLRLENELLRRELEDRRAGNERLPERRNRENCRRTADGYSCFVD